MAFLFFKMKGTITLNEALDVIHSGAIIAISGVRFDRKRKTGGDEFELGECRKVSEHLDAIKNHIKNFTFDFRIYVNGEPLDKIERVNMLLITSVNGKKVLL